MVIVDDRCTACGQCVRICHEDCISLLNGRVQIDYELCSTCTQCIAACPQQALSWDHVAPVAYDEARLPTPAQLDELFKQRRTIRSFKGEEIERALLAEIIGYGIYAPTNNYGLRAIVADDRDTIEELDRITMQFVSRIYSAVFKPRVVFGLLSRITPMIDPKDKVKMENVLERGHNFHRPAAIVFVVGDPRIALSEASAQYALYNVMLYAQTRGVGSCLWGNGQVFLDRSRAARARLGLMGHEHILGALGLGYPAVRFRNKVEGKRLDIRWVDG